MHRSFLVAGLVSLLPLPSLALLCAGGEPHHVEPQRSPRLKALQVSQIDNRSAVVLFAQFSDSPAGQIPIWADTLFAADQPGSFRHFYDEMSFGRHQVRGEVIDRVFVAPSPASAYVSTDPTEPGGYSEFAQQIITAADAYVDFARFDNDGPDGIPDSGDDDGQVDALFIVVPHVPHGFIQGPATGVGRFRWRRPLATQDPGIDGELIAISSARGTLQQGRTFDEAVGSMAHEYGHVLGLPDLFDTEFLRTPDATPADDSAGIGNWGLMGWGARGWDGASGPTAFSAWSRVRLGWADVRDVRFESEDIFIEDVGIAGVVYRVPLTPRENFYIESRTPTVGTYDRDIPGTGLLIWHESRSAVNDSVTSRLHVDLECADGRWSDAGPPMGRHPDVDGEDNLDFWAHDQTYREAHAGNLGDRGDLFTDGMAFTPDTNPSATSIDGVADVAIQQIRRVESGMLASVRASPLIVHLDRISFGDETRDGLFVSGEPISVQFGVRNAGGLTGLDVRVALHSPSSSIEILAETADFGDLRVGGKDFLPDHGFPRFRFTERFVGEHSARLLFDVYASGQLIDQQEQVVVGVSPQLDVRGLELIDEEGISSPRARAGAIVTPVLQVANDLPEAFDGLIQALTPGIRSMGSEALSVRDGLASGPQLLIPLDAPDSVQIEVSTGSLFSVWRDTLAFAVQRGHDITPPLVRGARVRLQAGVLRVAVAENQYYDAGRIESTVASIAAHSGERVGQFPLTWREDAFRGRWVGDIPPQATLSIAMTDEAGNVGRGEPQAIATPVARHLSRNWNPLPLAEHGIEAALLGFAFWGPDPDVMFGVGQAGLLRSMDAGRTWERLPAMFSVPPSGVFASPSDLQVLFVIANDATWRTKDGGNTWSKPQLPGTLLGFDRRGVLFVGASDGLFASQDEGETWQQVSHVDSRLLLNDTAADGLLYSGHRSYYTGSSEEPGTLLRSTDGGMKWHDLPLPVVFETVVADAARADGLFAVRRDSLWRSADAGSTWNRVGPMPDGTAERSRFGFAGWGLHAARDGLRAWHGRKNVIATSSDGGVTWTASAIDEAPSGPVVTLYVDPLRPRRVFRTTHDFSREVVMKISDDFGESWQDLSTVSVRRPSGVVEFGDGGTILAGVGDRSEGLPVASIHRSGDGGTIWQQVGGVSIPFGFSGLLPSFAAWHRSPTRPDRVLSFIQSMSFRPLGSPFGYGAGGSVQLSHDGGQTWSQVSSIYASRSMHLVQLRGADIVTTASRDLWLGYHGDAFRKVGTQILADTASVTSLSVLSESGDVLAASVSRRIPSSRTDSPAFWRGHVVTDEWARVGDLGPTAQGHTVSDLEDSPSGDRLLALTGQGLFESHDRAVSWSLIDALPPGHQGEFRHLLFHPLRDNTYLVIGERALWLSHDHGTTWREVDGPLGLNYYNDAAFDPLDPSRLVVATPWGLYERDVALPRETAVDELTTIPVQFALQAAYPNPFNSDVTIRFSAAANAHIEMSIYNVLGQRVRTLPINNEHAGVRHVTWDGRDSRGHAVGTGVYVIRLRSEGEAQTRKVTLLR